MSEDVKNFTIRSAETKLKRRAQLLQRKGVSLCKIIRCMQDCYGTVRFVIYNNVMSSMHTSVH